MKTNNAGFTHTKNLAGAVHTEDGSIACVKLKCRRGRVTVDAAHTWSAANTLLTTRRMSGGAALAVAADWRRNASGTTGKPPLLGTNRDITPYFDQTKYNPFLEMLSGSVTTLTTDDSYLLTLPLAFADSPPASFLSVYFGDGQAMLGVVIEKKLEAVFSFPCGDAEGVEAAVGRVRRYWDRSLKRDDFPGKAFVLTYAVHEEQSEEEHYDLDGLDAKRLALPEKLDSKDKIVAAGAALAISCEAPQFALPRLYAHRAYRSVLIKMSAVLFVLSLTLTAAVALLNARAGKTLLESENIYRSKFNENKTLQDLDKISDDLAVRILSIQKAHSRSTRWGDLLLLFSEIRPADLFIDKLGTDDIKGQESSVRLALSGWSRSETSVTDFISGLQGSSFISNVSLSSMERDAKNKNFCRFRISCVIQLSND